MQALPFGLVPVCEFFKALELFAGGAGGHGAAGEGGGFAEVLGDSGDYERGGGVDDHNIELGACFSLQQCMDQFGIFFGRSAAEGFQGRWRDSEILGCDREAADAAFANFGDLRFAGERDFVKAAGAMNHESVSGAERRECGGHGVQHIGGEDAEDLGFCSRGIGKRAEKVENGALANLLARGTGVAGGGMSGGREEKAEAEFADGASSGKHRHVNVHAERFEDVG